MTANSQEITFSFQEFKIELETNVATLSVTLIKTVDRIQNSINNQNHGILEIIEVSLIIANYVKIFDYLF